MTMNSKAYRLGTRRTVTPAETLARVAPLMPVMGITRIANVTGLDRVGIPVVMVCRPNARSISVSQGKGLDLTAAKVSGLMEAVEAYHAEHITLPLKLGSYEELRYTHGVVDPAELPLAAQSPFQPDHPLLWIEGRELVGGSRLWLPHELVHANYTLPLPPGSGCFAANTNGLASGNHLLEATLHGICETIERDAVSLWHLQSAASRRDTGLALDSIEDQACREVLARFESAGIRIKVWEITSDIGVAAFYCLGVEQEGEFRQPADGSGCHPVREVALLRALTEAAQVRTTYIAGSRDDIDAEEYTPSYRANSLEQCLSIMACHQPRRFFREVPNHDGETFQADLDWVLERLQDASLTQVIVVDLSKPMFRLPVVRVVIPGLEGADETDDYVPGKRAQRLLEGTL
jgi:ribosomal protein S12 methylthiotransferase accessory factor